MTITFTSSTYNSYSSSSGFGTISGASLSESSLSLSDPLYSPYSSSESEPLSAFCTTISFFSMKSSIVVLPSSDTRRIFGLSDFLCILSDNKIFSGSIL